VQSNYKSSTIFGSLISVEKIGKLSINFSENKKCIGAALFSTACFLDKTMKKEFYLIADSKNVLQGANNPILH